MNENEINIESLPKCPNCDLHKLLLLFKIEEMFDTDSPKLKEIKVLFK